MGEGIEGGAEGRCVAQIQIRQIVHRDFSRHRSHQGVQTLVPPAGAHDLTPEDPPGAPVRHETQHQRRRSGHEVGEIGVHHRHPHGIETRLPGPRLVQAGARRREIEDPGDGGTRHPRIASRKTRDVVRDDAPLAVRRRSHGLAHGFPRQDVAHLHAVSPRVDGFVAGAKVVIHQNAPRGSQRQARLPGQGHRGTHPHRQQHQVRRKFPHVRPYRRHAPLFPQELDDPLAAEEGHPVPLQPPGHQSSKIPIQKSSQRAVQELHHGDLHPPGFEGLRHLQADEPRSHHHGPPHRPLLQRPGNLQGVLQGAEGKDPLQFVPRKIRAHRLGPQGEHQHVVGKTPLLAGFQLHRSDHAPLPVNVGGLVPREHLHVLHLAEKRRVPLDADGRARQGTIIRHHTAEKVGHAAPRVAGEVSPFQHGDGGLGIEPPQPRRHLAATRHAADDHHVFPHGQNLPDLEGVPLRFRRCPHAADQNSAKAFQISP